MNESEFEQLVEAGWRRAWTLEEERQVRQWLEAHPEKAVDLHLELRLSAALRSLPQPPLSSNFTSLAVQAARRINDARPIPIGWWNQVRGWFSRPIPRLASLGVTAFLLWAGYHQIQIQSQHQIARGVVLLSAAGELPETDSMEDFEAIRQLSHVQVPVDPVDEELFVVLSALNQ